MVLPYYNGSIVIITKKINLVILKNRAEMKTDRKKECDEVIRKFEEIRMRGRKRNMVG